MLYNRDTSLSALHETVVHTLVDRLLGAVGAARMMPYLPQIIPPFLQLMHAKTSNRGRSMASTTHTTPTSLRVSDGASIRNQV